MFIVICAFCIPLSGLSPSYLANEIVTRMGRNAFLILSLLIPIMAGMGLNFGMTLGAMAGEIGLIFVSDWQIVGIPGMVLAMIISIPISVLLAKAAHWFVQTAASTCIEQKPNKIRTNNVSI